MGERAGVSERSPDCQFQFVRFIQRYSAECLLGCSQSPRLVRDSSQGQPRRFDPLTIYCNRYCRGYQGKFIGLAIANFEVMGSAAFYSCGYLDCNDEIAAFDHVIAFWGVSRQTMKRSPLLLQRARSHRRHLPGDRARRVSEPRRHRRVRDRAQGRPPVGHPHVRRAGRTAAWTRQVGPYRIEVLEPLQRVRLVCDGAEHGIGFDLTWEGSFAAVDGAAPRHADRAPGRSSTPRGSRRSARGKACSTSAATSTSCRRPLGRHP